MTQDIGEHLKKLTSRQGRYWLRDSRGQSASSEIASTETANEDLPFQSVSNTQTSSRSPAHESVVVTIPNVAALNAKATGNAARNAQNAASQTANLQRKLDSNRQLNENTRIVAPLPTVQPNRQLDSSCSDNVFRTRRSGGFGSVRRTARQA